MPDESRKNLVQHRTQQPLEAVRNFAGGFDVDAWHVMEERDNALIQDEILHGAGSSKFVYDFEISGTKVAGISVVGARHLASHYGGMKHRMVASIQKVGSLFTFTSYPQEGTPMDVRCATIPDLADEPDFYGALVEITDVKTGNSIQIERRENRFERKRDGSHYERPNYATIAQSKAYRNAVLALIPQDVQIKWKTSMLALGKSEIITDSVIDQKRAGILQFAAKNALPLDRERVHALTFDQIAGLADAAREGKVPAFAQSLVALGVVAAHDQGTGEVRELPAANDVSGKKGAKAKPAQDASAAQATGPAHAEGGGEGGGQSSTDTAKPGQGAQEQREPAKLFS